MPEINANSTTALLLGALSIAALHALIPSHWLAFALVGRAQRWTVRRALTITMLAGAGHVLLTIALGLIIALVGKGLLRAIPPAVEHAATAGLLIALGLFFAVSGLRRDGCHHHGHKHEIEVTTEGEPEESAPVTASSSLTARLAGHQSVMGALILGMTLSPCLDLLTIYVAAAAAPWPVWAAISLIMAVTTIGLMGILVWLTLRGLERVKLTWLETNEGLVVGVVLVLLGVLLFFL